MGQLLKHCAEEDRHVLEARILHSVQLTITVEQGGDIAQAGRPSEWIQTVRNGEGSSSGNVIYAALGSRRNDERG